MTSPSESTEPTAAVKRSRRPRPLVAPRDKGNHPLVQVGQTWRDDERRAHILRIDAKWNRRRRCYEPYIMYTRDGTDIYGLTADTFFSCYPQRLT